MTDDERAALVSWGWTAEFDAVFAALRAPELIAGRVRAPGRGEHRVATGSGERVARVRRRLEREASSARELPAAGDWVALSEEVGSALIVEHVLPRRSSIVRRAAGAGDAPQVVAANVDSLWIVVSLAEELSPGRLERYARLATRGGATPFLVATKADLARPTSATRAELESACPGVEAIEVSAADGRGLQALRARIPPGVTVALVGPSGVGKSTLVNALLGEERQRTATVRARDGKGRHQTTRRELFRLAGGGVVIDTPGLREIGLWNDPSAALPADPLAVFAGSCRFSDCSHRTEPGCAVRAAVAAGDLGQEQVDRSLALDREQRAAPGRTGERWAGRVGGRAARAGQARRRS